MLWYSGLNFALRSIIVKDNLLSLIEKVTASLHPYWVVVKGRSIDFIILSMLSTEIERLCGMLAPMALLSGHPLLDAQSASIIYSELQQDCL